jgi:phosphate transport system permease protein
VASETTAKQVGNDLGVDLDDHVKRIGRQDRVATGILTVIVAFVLLLLASIVAFILIQGPGQGIDAGLPHHVSFGR